ncbi:response regulator [Streptomyces sp. NPDC048436]|uniref:response regulator n=1 Tax=Streptomyces sp. NPDC048436 TaxID=3365550 RepID=UPI00371C606D
MVRVLVADAHAAARAGFSLLVGSAPDMTVVGAAADGTGVVEAALRTRPDVVLMDTHLRGIDGVEATARITGDQRLAGVRVLVLTIHDDDEHLFRSLAAGASGFLPIDTEPEDLLKAIRATADGQSWLNPRHTRRLVDSHLARNQPGVRPAQPSVGAPDPALDELSNREREVFALVGHGLTNQEIAERLSLSPLTAKTYVSRIMAKLGARDRVQLAISAIGSGLARTPVGRPRGRTPAGPVSRALPGRVLRP